MRQSSIFSQSFPPSVLNILESFRHTFIMIQHMIVVFTSFQSHSHTRRIPTHSDCWQDNLRSTHFLRKRGILRAPPNVNMCMHTSKQTRQMNNGSYFFTFFSLSLYLMTCVSHLSSMELIQEHRMRINGENKK